MNKMITLILSLFLLLFLHATANAQSYTQNEQTCFNMVQGNVAYSKAGHKVWIESNVRELCQGTADPGVTIACFNFRIATYDDWQRGLRECTPAALNSYASAPSKVVRDTNTNVQPPVDNGMVTRIVTIRNKSGMVFEAYLRDRENYTAANDSVALKVFARTQNIALGERTVGESIRTPKDKAVEFWIRQSDDPVPMFKASLPHGAGAPTSFCYEITGTYFVPNAKACDNGPTYESKHISFRNESGFNSTMSLTYYPTGGGSIKIAKTRSTTAGYQTKLYLPMDADSDKQMVLKVDMDLVNSNYLTKNVILSDFDTSGSTCYKAWGSAFNAKVSPCSVSATARKVKLWNNAGYPAKIIVTYGPGQTVESNFIELTQTETIEVPDSTSANPVKIDLFNKWGTKLISTFTTSANFTGELCYKVEGTTFAPTAATCDGTVGDTTGDTRQIRFQNDSGFDAALIITYFEDQVINGQTMAMPRTLSTGMINGLGKSRVVTMPLKTSGSMPITISLQGNATVKNDIWSTTLPANFAASPQPCFKVWGTFLSPQGGKCDQ